MLEESLASVKSWFTPTLLFVFLNIVIGTIAIASNFETSSHTHKQQQETDLPCSSSFIYLRAPVSNASTSTVSDPKTSTHSPPQLNHPHNHNNPISFHLQKFKLQKQQHKKKNTLIFTKTHNDILEHSRTKSDTRPTSGDMPVRLPQKMMKSASTKSAFWHFEFEELADEGEEMNKVEKMRPSTARDSKKKMSTDLQTFGEDQEVDAKADDFINSFKQQLKLQRLDSLIRYKQILTRGANN